MINKIIKNNSSIEDDHIMPWDSNVKINGYGKNVIFIPANDPSPKIKQAAIYARVSTVKKSTVRSLCNQVEYYGKSLRNNPDYRLIGAYTDLGISGAVAERPGFKRLIRDCEDGKIDIVFTKSIPRFSRDLVTFLQNIYKLRDLGIDVYFENENLHSLSLECEMMLHFFATIAEMTSRRASNERKLHIQNLYKKGKVYSCNVYGYRQKDNRLVVSAREAKIVRMIFEEYLAGNGLISICNKLNSMHTTTKRQRKWRCSTISFMLRDEIYIGNLILQKTFRESICGPAKPNNGEYDKTEVLNSHEAIISKEMFDAVQKEIAKRSKKYSRKEKTSSRISSPASDKFQATFKGKIVCSQCGSPMYRRTDSNGNGKNLVWHCTGYHSRGKEICAFRQIPDKILMDTTKDVLKNSSEQEIDRIKVLTNHKLEYVTNNGKKITITWEHPSRKESWTPEMKEAARQKRLLYLAQNNISK